VVQVLSDNKADVSQQTKRLSW